MPLPIERSATIYFLFCAAGFPVGLNFTDAVCPAERAPSSQSASPANHARQSPPRRSAENRLAAGQSQAIPAFRRNHRSFCFALRSFQFVLITTYLVVIIIRFQNQSTNF